MKKGKFISIVLVVVFAMSLVTSVSADILESAAVHECDNAHCDEEDITFDSITVTPLGNQYERCGICLTLYYKCPHPFTKIDGITGKVTTGVEYVYHCPVCDYCGVR